MKILSVALTLLSETEGADKYANLALRSHKTDALTADERRLLTSLFYTVTEKRLTYDYYIGAISGRSTEDISPRALNILRIGTCLILDMSSVPDHAAVDESVKLAKSAGERAFVNAVLREIARRKDAMPMPKRDKNVARYLSVAYSFPQRTVKHFITLIGEEQTEKLLRRFNTARYTDISVNTLVTDRETYLSSLIDAGYDATLSAYSSLGIRINSSVDPTRLPGYSDGAFFVQDEAGAVLSDVLAPLPGMTVVDVCSAPGGKCFAAASLSHGDGCFYAFDLRESKLSLIRDGAKRLGFDKIKVAARDARLCDESLVGTADRVICDVPCSGLGILSKKPDIRYKSIEDTKELCELQYEILKSSSRYLKDGGVFVYSTCTLNPDENENIVSRFLGETSDFTLLPFEQNGLKSDTGMLVLYPHVHNTDGFFIAKLQRKGK